MLTPEELMRIYGPKQSDEPEEDPWEELLKLAMHDPYVRRAVDMVRYRGMTVGEACTYLALYQTRRAATLQDELVNLHKLSPQPMRIIVSAERFDEIKTEFEQA